MFGINTLFKTFIFWSFLFSLLILGSLASGQTFDSLGPGVAGQFHSLVYDPDLSGTVYAGGDNCGVYRSSDYGATWELMNQGLENTDYTMSYYVDDLLVLGNSSGAKTDFQGLYAATIGGIYFMSRDASEWRLLTDYSADCRFWYKGGAAGSAGAPVPYSCLAFDEQNKLLYAGTGHGRWISGDFEFLYPHAEPGFEAGCGGSEIQQYSIWSADVSIDCSDIYPVWEAKTDTDAFGKVTQIAVVPHSGISEVVVASQSGLFSFGDPGKNPSAPSVPVDVWENHSAQLTAEGWSAYHRGVVAGSEGYAYVLAENSPNDPELRAGVYIRDMADSNSDWVFLGDAGEIMEPNDSVYWFNGDSGDYSSNISLLHPDWQDEDGVGVHTLSVLRDNSNEHEDDQVFVGIRRTTRGHGGFYRYCQTGSFPGWSQILGVYRNRAEGVWDYFSYDWRIDSAVDLDPGWNSNRNSLALTPLAISTDGNHMMAPISLFLFKTDDAGQTWGQNYCTGSDPSGWTSTGPNIMNCFTGDFLSDGSLVIGAADVGVFAATSSLNNSFSWLNWNDENGARRCEKVVVLAGVDGDEVYSLRQSMKDPASGSLYNNYAKQSVARLVDRLDPWQYLSSGIDDYFSASFSGLSFTINDLKKIDDNNLLMAVNLRDGLDSFGKIFHSTRDQDGTFSVWTPLPQFPDVPVEGQFIGHRSKLMRIELIPESDGKFLIGTHQLSQGNSYRSGVYCFSLNDPDFFQIWLETDYIAPVSAIDIATTFVDVIKVDTWGTVAYVGTQGLPGRAPTRPGIGTVLRFEIPEDWNNIPEPEILVNENLGGEAGFGMVTPFFDYYTDDYDVPKVLTKVEDIAIDPNNPNIIYAGIGRKGLHPSNGVWKFDYNQAVGNRWSHIAGAGKMSTSVVLIDPDYAHDQTVLYYGTIGQEIFTTVIGIHVPLVAEHAVYPLPTGADQTPLLAVQVASRSGFPLETVFVDVSSIGGPAHLVLNDSELNGDLFAGDGIWSSQITEELAGSGLNLLRLIAKDELQNTSNVELQVDLIAGSVARYEDRTGDTGLVYFGQPFSAVTIDFDGDQFKDMFISIEGEPGQLYLSNGLDGNVPAFEEAPSYVFPDGLPPITLLGLAVADYNNDGDQDIFCASQDHPRLYVAHAGAFHDSTSQQGLDVVGLESVAASWGDYDKDGRVDLAIGRSGLNGLAGGDLLAERLPDFLLHNDTGIGGGFSDVSAGAGIVPTDVTSCITVTWCDVNSDGYLDLFFGDTRENPRDSNVGYTLNMFLNQGDGTFFESWRFPLTGSQVSGIECADLNNDGFFDVILSSQNLSSRVFLNNGSSNFDLDSAAVFNFSRSNVTSGLRIFDFDLDGFQDVLFLPGSASSQPVLMGNFSTSGQFEFKDLTPVVGLDYRGAVGGAIAADFNHDGDLDLFLARKDTVQNGSMDVEVFFQAMNRIPGIDEPSNNWVSVDLSSSNGVNNTMGIGAVVTLTTGDLVQTQQVDGGSGRGGQADHTLMFGLGNHSTVGSLAVTWTNGYSQVEILELGVKEYEIEDETTLCLNPGKVSGTYDVVPGTPSAKINMTFGWNTSVATPFWRDQVTLLSGSGSCFGSDITLGYDSADVEITITRNSNGSFRHVLKWSNQPCISDCTFDFTVKSGAGGEFGVSEESTSSLSISVCGSFSVFGQ